MCRVVIEWKDRLARFGFTYIKKLFDAFNVELEIINHRDEQRYEEEITEDIIAIMTSYSAHTAAALVVARRGMGICEKIKVSVSPLLSGMPVPQDGAKSRIRVTSGENEKLNLAGRGFKIALTKKAYSYFKYLYRVLEVKSPGLTAPCLNST